VIVYGDASGNTVQTTGTSDYHIIREFFTEKYRTPLHYRIPKSNPGVRDRIKTENFSYTGGRDLNLAKTAIVLPMQLGFPRAQSSHLVGIGDYTTPWRKEERLA